MRDLPIPPIEMRQAVGPTDPEAFDNPYGAPVFPDLPAAAYRSVLDFGCGCGRLARQMIQQQPQPEQYLGIDLHPVMIEWCRNNLTPAAPSFEFRHHDVHYPSWNPGEGKPDVLPFPGADGERSLVIAHSVFTHLIQAHAEHYLAEVARVLAPDGYFEGTWFLFDKRGFPMMQEFQNALYINDLNPTNAVIFDRRWLIEVARSKGLAIVAARGPVVRGYHWRITMRPSASGAAEIELPEDEAPLGAGEGTRAVPFEPKLKPEQAAPQGS
jgi:SAM-dependent methyltransferase